MDVYHIHAWCLQKSEEDVGFSRTGVTDGCEPLSVRWETHLGPLQDQHMLLTTEPPSHPTSGFLSGILKNSMIFESHRFFFFFKRTLF